MCAKITAVDQYILKSQAFAQPILIHLRELVHRVCPDVEEKIKWGMPFFDYKGEMLCHMAAFKQHAVFSFWKASLMKDPVLMENAKAETAMGHLGKLTTLKDLPSDKKLTAWIKEAMDLNDKGIKIKKEFASNKTVKALDIPAPLLKAIKADKAAKANWDAANYSFKKEYATWVAEAKTDATRDKRIKEAVLLISEGKGRHWKYQK